MKFSAPARFAAALALLSLTTLAQQSPTPPSAPAKHSDTADPGTLTDGLYRNPSFAFSYKLPFGWVDRTQQMRDDSADSKSWVLLAAFERPPEATGNTVNSAVIIAAESVSSYPGLKTAAQYFGPLAELTVAKGFKVVNEPYEFPVDTKPLVREDFVREDFRKPVASLTMYQSSLALLQKGYVLSFTLIGGSDDEVTALIEGLTFSVSRQSKSTHPQPASK
jgi:hypothetical protein